ncbi:putative transcription factor AP2-EREBP family [Helianthus annuus]|nr:putative transcription factor AP2-EREBP family [Helianthus annuus]KAJ0430910.1 putative transcription factor AP2-EREBP family [Helianthus annuus]
MKPESERGGSSSMHEAKYRGVRLRKWGKWVSEIWMPNSRERIWLGSYDSPEQAARAFDAATFCLRGHAAKFNFPDQHPSFLVQLLFLHPRYKLLRLAMLTRFLMRLAMLTRFLMRLAMLTRFLIRDTGFAIDLGRFDPNLF